MKRHVNKYQINERAKPKMCASRLSVGVVLLFGEWTSRKRDLHRHELDSSRSSFGSYVRFFRWSVGAAVSCSSRCVVPVSLFRCVLFVLWFLSGDGCICHCHRLRRRRRQQQQHCPLLYFINHVPNSIRSFIDITITNSEQRTCTKYSRNENSLSNSFV